MYPAVTSRLTSFRALVSAEWLAATVHTTLNALSFTRPDAIGRIALLCLTRLGEAMVSERRSQCSGWSRGLGGLPCSADDSAQVFTAQCATASRLGCSLGGQVSAGMHF
eukprot:3139742-Rhodomonas_salina.4